MSLLSDVRIGAQLPTWCRSPNGAVSSAGDEAIDLAAAAGLVLDEWQRWVLRESLGERSGGTWAAFECGLVVGRQNGKNAILEARELAGIVLFGDDLITHTAHRADTTLEHFRRMEQYAEEFDEFGKLVKHVSHKNGDESIELKGGRRIKFVSRARQPGRGFSGSCVVFDEALYLSPSAIGAIVPTLATRPMAQVWYTSSAPKADSSNLHAVMSRGRSNSPDDERLFYAEWGNPSGTSPDEVDAWYRANPGLGIRISEEYIRAERRLMSGDPELESEFMRERVGIAETPDENAQVIPANVWKSLANDQAVPASHECWALAVSPDRDWASLGLAARTSDGKVLVEWIDHRRGTSWVLARVEEGWAKHRRPIRIHKSGPEKAFIAPLRERGVDVVEVSTSEVEQATGQLCDAANAGELVHLGQPSLDKALRGAVLRVSSDGASIWSQRNSSVEITPLVAVTVALGGVPQTVAEPSIYVWQGGAKR